MSAMLEDFSVATFADRLGETFRLHLESGTSLAFELIDARGVAGDSDGRDPFSIVFRAPATPVLELAGRVLHVRRDHRDPLLVAGNYRGTPPEEQGKAGNEKLFHTGLPN